MPHTPAHIEHINQSRALFILLHKSKSDSWAAVILFHIMLHIVEALRYQLEMANSTGTGERIDFVRSNFPDLLDGFVQMLEVNRSVRYECWAVEREELLDLFDNAFSPFAGFFLALYPKDLDGCPTFDEARPA